MKWLWCHLRRRKSAQRSLWKRLHVPSGETDFFSLMGQSSHYFRSLAYMGRPGLIKTKTILSTARCVLTISSPAKHWLYYFSRSTACLKIFWSLITRWATQAVYTMHGHSTAHGRSKTMISSLAPVSGCGQTWCIHRRRGVSGHLRSLSTGSSLQTRGLSTIGY